MSENGYLPFPPYFMIPFWFQVKLTVNENGTTIYSKSILHYHFSFWLYFWKLSLNFAPKQNRNLDFSIHSLNNKKQNVCSRCMNGGRKTTKTELRVSNEFRMCSKTNVHRTSSVNTIIILRHLLFSSFNFSHCTDNLNLNKWRWREKKCKRIEF